METNINNIFFSRIEAIADKWLKISETSHQGSASLNLNHEIFNRDLDVTNAKELDKAEMRRERYEKMKADQAKSQNNLKSARDWDPNQTHPAEILDLDFSKHEPHKKVNWDNVARKSGESFMFCAEECPNEIAKRKERESEANKKRAKLRDEHFARNDSFVERVCARFRNNFGRISSERAANCAKIEIYG